MYDDDDDYDYDDDDEPQRGAWQRRLATVIFSVALLVLAYGFVIRPWVSRTIGERIASELETQITAQIEGQLAGQIEGQLEGQLTEQLSGAAGDNSIPMATLAAALETAAATAGIPIAALDESALAGDPAAQEAAQAVTALAGALEQALAEPSTIIVIGSTATTVAGTPPAGAAPPSDTGIEQTDQPANASTAPPSASDTEEQPTRDPTGPTPTDAPDATATPEATPTPIPTTTPEPIATALPRVIEALPEGDIVVTEAEANRRIARRLEGTGPIEEATMRFFPDEMRVRLVILGTVNEVRSGLTVNNGRVAVRNPVLTGPISLLISVDDLIEPIERQVNTSIGVTDRELLAIRIETGQIVVTIR